MKREVIKKIKEFFSKNKYKEIDISLNSFTELLNSEIVDIVGLMKLNQRQIDILLEVIKTNKTSLPKISKPYYFIGEELDELVVDKAIWHCSAKDISRLKSCNCFIDEDLARQVNLDRKLNDKLKHFINGTGMEIENLLDKGSSKFKIFFDAHNKKWVFKEVMGCIDIDTAYFTCSDLAKRAIDEIVIPFCKENPDYMFSKQMFKNKKED